MDKFESFGKPEPYDEVKESADLLNELIEKKESLPKTKISAEAEATKIPRFRDYLIQIDEKAEKTELAEEEIPEEEKDIEFEPTYEPITEPEPVEPIMEEAEEEIREEAQQYVPEPIETIEHAEHKDIDKDISESLLDVTEQQEYVDQITSKRISFEETSPDIVYKTTQIKKTLAELREDPIESKMIVEETEPAMAGVETESEISFTPPQTILDTVDKTFKKPEPDEEKEIKLPDSIREEGLEISPEEPADLKTAFTVQEEEENLEGVEVKDDDKILIDIPQKQDDELQEEKTEDYYYIDQEDQDYQPLLMIPVKEGVPEISLPQMEEYAVQEEKSEIESEDELSMIEDKSITGKPPIIDDSEPAIEDSETSASDVVSELKKAISDKSDILSEEILEPYSEDIPVDSQDKKIIGEKIDIYIPASTYTEITQEREALTPDESVLEAEADQYQEEPSINSKAGEPDQDEYIVRKDYEEEQQPAEEILYEEPSHEEPESPVLPIYRPLESLMEYEEAAAGDLETIPDQLLKPKQDDIKAPEKMEQPQTAEQDYFQPPLPDIPQPEKSPIDMAEYELMLQEAKREAEEFISEKSTAIKQPPAATPEESEIKEDIDTIPEESKSKPQPDIKSFGNFLKQIAPSRSKIRKATIEEKELHRPPESIEPLRPDIQYKTADTDGPCFEDEAKIDEKVHFKDNKHSQDIKYDSVPLTSEPAESEQEENKNPLKKMIMRFSKKKERGEEQ